MQEELLAFLEKEIKDLKDECRFDANLFLAGKLAAYQEVYSKLTKPA